MNFNFERFKNTGSSYSPKISIRSNGSIGFSQGALHRFKLREGEWYVVMFYDRVAQVIGIKPTQDKEEPNIIKLNKKEAVGKENKISVNAFISAKSFLEFYNISYNKTKSYQAEWSEENQMIILKINNNENHGGGDTEEED